MASTRTYTPTFPTKIHGQRPDAPPDEERTPATPPGDAKGKTAFLQQRLVSLDVYRGLIMITLAFVGFGLAGTARNYLKAEPTSEVWQIVYHNFEHVEWVGCGYWDLIQPSFMFMVGVAMAFSYAKRREQGATWSQSFWHVVIRSVVLICLGIFLISNGAKHTDWSLLNVLTQIGLGYTFLFLLWNRPFWLQALAAVALLAGTWALYTQYPAQGINLAKGAPEVGVSAKWAQENLQGIAPAWQKNVNVGHAVDVWLYESVADARKTVGEWTDQQDGALYVAGTAGRTLIPDVEPFRFNRGGYQTINFITELVTMLFGLMCGELLRSRFSAGMRCFILTSAGIVGIAAGFALDYYGICPMVKRIWTPSWTLFSTGWCCLILASLYLVVDVLKWRWWTFPLVVVGVNSIAIYCMSMLLKRWGENTLMTHFGPDVFKDFGWGYIPLEFLPTVTACLVGMMFWLACLWLYRQKIFVRV